MDGQGVRRRRRPADDSGARRAGGRALRRDRGGDRQPHRRLSGGVGGLLSVLAHSGLSLETLTALVPQLLALLEQRGGPALLQRIAASVPMLRDFLGGAGSAGGDVQAAAPQGTDVAGEILGDLGKMFSN